MHWHGFLERIFITYPLFKLKNEGLIRAMVKSHALLETFLLGEARCGHRWPTFVRILQHAKVDNHD